MIKPQNKDGNTKRDPWKLNEALSNISNDIQEVLSYNPYYEANSPFILSIEFTNKSIYFLLKNGNIVKFGGQTPPTASRRRMEEVYSSIDSIQQIKIPTKVIDISCGYEHCLARGRDCKIFSWGINSYGQLGLENLNVGFSSEKLEPDFIPKLNQYKIVQIYATQYNSFCIADDNAIFGFGNNDQGQIKASNESKIAIPERMNIFDPKIKDFKIVFNKKGSNLYYSEIALPSKLFEKSLTKQIDRHQYDNEFQLKTEIRNLKDQLNQFRLKVTVEDFTNLIQDIQRLKIKYEEKANKLRRNSIKSKENQNSVINPIHIFDKQIEYFQNRKAKAVENSLNAYYNMIDERALQSEEKKEKESANVLIFNKHVPQLLTLIERVASELQVEKYRYIDSYIKDEELKKIEMKKIRENNDYIALFNQVIEEVKIKIESLYDKDTFNESESIKLKCGNEYQNFKQNTLNELTISNLDLQKAEKSTLNDFIKKSSIIFQKTLEKMKNLQVNEHSNKIGKSILDAFNDTLLIAHQNNYLLSFLLNNQVSYVYKNTMDKAYEYYNLKEFVELKRTVEVLKKEHDNKEYNTYLKEVSSQTYKNDKNNQSVSRSELWSDDEEN